MMCVQTKNIGMSDHLPTMAIRYKGKALLSENSSNTFSYRDLKRLDMQKFVDELRDAPWEAAFVFEDTNNIVDIWYKICTDVLDSQVPVKQKRLKKRKQPKWFTTEISDHIKKRDGLLNKARISGSPDDWATFKQVKNKVCSLMSSTKEQYFKNQFAEHENNPKRLWGLIKNLTRHDVNNHASIRQLKDGDQVITSTLDITECLNFWSVKEPLELLRNLPSNKVTHVSLQRIKDLRKDDRKAQFTISYITPENIETLLQSMPFHKATGSDGLGAQILEIVARAISLPLSRLINHCINTSTFPSVWKSAKVTPIYKGQGRRDDKNNYRPISVLPSLSKVFVKHIHQALYNYIRNNDFLYILQSGFRRSHSIGRALIRLIDQLLSDMDKDHVSGLVFVDYKKTFDLIDHGILLSKLEAYGVASKELLLLENQLNDRRQSVVMDGIQSEHRLITNGVPQGSVLGSLLFVIFINDLPLTVSRSIVDIYMDDTMLRPSAAVSDLPAVQQ